jgi:NAD-dependent oxidoreductase involved in siderophore biosynthesis
MAASFIVIRTFTIKEGKLEGFKQFLREFFKIIEANEPRLLAINAYVNEDGTEVSFVLVHPDATSVEHHHQVAHEHTERAHREFLDAATSIQVYGKPSDVVLEKTKQLARTTGVPLSAKPEHLGGFTRLPATAG